MSPTQLQLLLLLLTLSALLSLWCTFLINGGYHILMDSLSTNSLPNTPSSQPPGLFFIKIQPLNTHLRQAIFVNLPLLQKTPQNVLGRPLMRLLMADMTVGMTVVTTIVLEGGRGGGRRWLSLLIWLFLLANLTSGVVLPGFFFWYHRNVTIAAKSKSKPRGKVETALLSVLIGFTLPGILTFDPFSYGPEFQSYAIAGFVLFPVWIVGLQCVILPRFWRSGLVLIPAGKRRLSRKVQDRVVLIILGIGVAVVHFGTVWGVWLTGGGLEGLRGLVLRDVILRPEDEGGLYVRLLMFMQLDHLVTGVVMLVVAGEWVRNRMRTVGEGVGVVVGIALGGLVLGPGGVLAFAWAWRGRDEEEDEDKGRGEWKEK